MKESSRGRRSKYSEEYKRDAVALTAEKSVSAVAKELGISYSLLIRWRQKQRALSQVGEKSLSHKDLLIAYQKLREDLRKSREDLLKNQNSLKEVIENKKKIEKDYHTTKAINNVFIKHESYHFPRSSREKHLLIYRAKQDSPSVTYSHLVAYFGLSRSGFYQWLKIKETPIHERKPSRKDKIKAKILDLFEKFEGTYGSPRIHQELKALGCSVCEQTVAKYMREMGLRAVLKKRSQVKTTDSLEGPP